VTRETSLNDALKLMERYNVRHLPVVEDEQLGGIVSDRELLESTGWLSGQASDSWHSSDVGDEPETIGDIMREGVMSASPEQPVDAAAVTMMSQKIGSLPIEKDGVLVGLVTETDLLQLFLKDHRRILDSGGAQLHAAQLMTSWPITAKVDMTLAQARAILRANDVGHVPIVEDDRLIGIISDRDLRRAHGQGLRSTTPIAEVMMSSPATVTRDTTIDVATNLILENRISALPVIEGDDVLVGILTVEDLMDGFLDELEDEQGTDST